VEATHDEEDTMNEERDRLSANTNEDTASDDRSRLSANTNEDAENDVDPAPGAETGRRPRRRFRREKALRGSPRLSTASAVRSPAVLDFLPLPAAKKL
jgi:hypothetical protein